MRLSVIIPAYDAQATLTECLKSIRESDLKDYELIVIDDGSQDKTLNIAKSFADHVIVHRDNIGRSEARNSGIRQSTGEILLFIDSDIVVLPDTLSKVATFFNQHPEFDALSGRLSREHPHKNFFSQYKNLYMHYIFGLLPTRINFLYGSVHAIQRSSLSAYGMDVRVADDTALGQEMAIDGKKIYFDKSLEVVHLKSYGFKSIIRNDFRIPFDWTKIFIRYKGWKQLGKNKTGYAHSPKEQLFSIILMPFMALLFFGMLLSKWIASIAVILVLVWVYFNRDFHIYLFKERGIWFGLRSISFTFLDQFIMMCGICTGIILNPFRLKKKYAQIIHHNELKKLKTKHKDHTTEGRQSVVE